MARESLIDDPKYWFDLLEARNLSVHTYQEDLAEKIYQIAIDAIPEFENLLKKLNEMKSNNNFGLDEEDWNIVYHDLILPLKNKNARVWIFGSRALGSHGKFSDLDILFEEREEISLSYIGDLKEKMEESRLSVKICYPIHRLILQLRMRKIVCPVNNFTRNA